MNKKLQNVLLLVILVVFCLTIFAACNKKPDFFNYSDKQLGLMGQLVRWMHGWIKNYGWTVVVFTVFLKIIMLPLDIWQRYASRKSSLKMQQIQPLMDSIDKKYGANTQRSNEEKQKLYKKQGVGMLSSCLPMLVSMAIFFVMFAGLRNYSTYSSITNFKNLTNVYYDTYTQQIEDGDATLRDAYYKGYDYVNDSGKEVHLKGYNDYMKDFVEGQGRGEDEEEVIIKCQSYSIETLVAVDEKLHNNHDITDAYEQDALSAVKGEYDKNHESWLWIKNVWQPDTWATVMQPYAGSGFKSQFNGGGFSNSIDISGNFPDAENFYNKIRNAVMEGDGYNGKGNWNGLMILPFASIGLSFLSMFISQRMERKNRKGEMVEQNQQQKVTNRTMMIIMPLMMAWFGFIYTGAFAIYMVVNYTLSIISTIVLRRPIEKMVMKRLNKEESKNNTAKAKYMR